MKLSDMIRSYATKPKMKARLILDINIKYEFRDDEVMPAGTISDLLIERDDGSYHFEALDTAIIVQADEIEFI